MTDRKFHRLVLDRKKQLEKMRMRELEKDMDLTEEIGLLIKNEVRSQYAQNRRIKNESYSD